MNKSVYPGQAILDLSKTLIYKFHYDYMQPKYGCEVEVCYLDTCSFVYGIETEDFYRDITKDVKTKLDISRYLNGGNRPLPVGRNKKVIGMMKDELGGKNMTEIVALRAEMYAYRKQYCIVV